MRKENKGPKKKNKKKENKPEPSTAPGTYDKNGQIGPEKGTIIDIDAAMATKGGIDLNTEEMDLERDGAMASLDLNNATEKEALITGLVPVILEMTPMANARGFMGLPAQK